MADVSSGPVQLVWFKRDLRIDDHAPLVKAAERGPVVALYVYDPVVLTSPDFDSSHLMFANECLTELDGELRNRGIPLTVRHGRVIEVLESLHRELGIAALWSHQETGNQATFDRDREVKHWCDERGVPWTEIPQHGVFRPHGRRDGWSSRWRARMNTSPLDAPEVLRGPTGHETGEIMTPEDLGLPPSARTDPQRGGSSRGYATLEEFLGGRGRDYARGMSSPLTAPKSCSRLSPHFAYGAVSLRRVWHETNARTKALRIAAHRGDPEAKAFAADLASFQKRLFWHCHFTQKLEDEPALEFRNMARAYDGLRGDEPDEARFAAWAEGRTGFPMVDACMRWLHATGWINFRMRAMLVSFASYQLWMPWRPTALHLARLFVDFEPGIHYPQVQMQSGTTGINTLRIYSPKKQALDHDPDGVFVRRWVPELAGVPDEHIIEPHKMPSDVQAASGCRIGPDYPAPIVNNGKAMFLARQRLQAVRRRSPARREAQTVFQRHGSRRGARG